MFSSTWKWNYMSWSIWNKKSVWRNLKWSSFLAREINWNKLQVKIYSIFLKFFDLMVKILKIHLLHLTFLDLKVIKRCLLNGISILSNWKDSEDNKSHERLILEAFFNVMIFHQLFSLQTNDLFSPNLYLSNVHH